MCGGLLCRCVCRDKMQSAWRTMAPPQINTRLYILPLKKCHYTPMRCSKITRLQHLAASPESKVFPESWTTKSNQSSMLLQNVLDACSSLFLSFNFTPAQKNQYEQLKPTAVDPPQCVPPVLGRGSFDICRNLYHSQKFGALSLGCSSDWAWMWKSST